MLKKLRPFLLLAAGLTIAAMSTPLSAKDRERPRAERPATTETPYSNRSVRRDREALRQERAARRDAEPDHYQFRKRRSDDR